VLTVSRSCWVAAAVGIAGALVIAKPTLAGWDSEYLVALFGTSLNGLAFVLNKYLQRDDSEATTMLYTSLVLVFGNLPVLAMTVPPSPEILPWLPGLLLLGPVGMYLGIAAVKRASAAMLGPYTLLRLVIGALGGVAIFHEAPDIWTGVGIVLIVASCVLAARGSARRQVPLDRASTLRGRIASRRLGGLVGGAKDAASHALISVRSVVRWSPVAAK
jgi:drug/metabolite transporter (DMT)-like permease